MSHNIITVNGEKPDVTGNLELALSSLTDVNLTSPSAGDLLKYDGTLQEWFNVGSIAQEAYVGDGSSTDYSLSGATSTASGSVVYFYDASPVMSITGGSLSPLSGWVQSVTLPVGDYIVSAVVGLTFSASTGVATYRIFQDGGALGTTGQVGYATLDVGARAIARVTVATGTSTVEVRLTSSTSANSIASQSTRHAERGYLSIRRV